MSKEASKIIPHEVVRLDVEVRESYDDFRLRFESAVPAWNADRGKELVERRAPWPEWIAGSRIRA